MHQTLTSMDGPLLGRVNYVKELIINHFRITIVVRTVFQKRNARVDVPLLIDSKWFTLKSRSISHSNALDI